MKHLLKSTKMSSTGCPSSIAYDRCPSDVSRETSQPENRRDRFPSSGRTFYVCDNVTRRRFLVDTGAQISVVPPTPVDRRCPSPGLHLQAANCSPISTFGSRSLTLNIGLRRLFSWIFVIADVPHSILGSDFLAEFDLRVDCRRSCLLDRTTGLSVRGLTPFNDSCNLSVLDTVFARPRRLAASRLQAAKAEFEHMLQLGIIRPSENPWASPLHMVPKATSDDWRPCGDYRALNNATIPDRYPVPHLQDAAGALFGKSVFSKIDLVWAFHQIPVAPRDVPKTAVTTPFGLFEFIRMPFGLRNAAQTFQRCVLGVPSLDFLGHHVDAQGLRPLSSKVEAIRDFPPPTSKRQLQRFLGMVHKDGVPLRPIVSLIGTPTYGLAKWLFRCLKFLTAESDTTVSSSAQFLEKLKGDLAIETIQLLLQCKYDETENRLGHAQILQLLKLCLRTYFTFDGTVYEQVKGTPMSSPRRSCNGKSAGLPTPQTEVLGPVLTFPEQLNAVFPDIQITMEEEENNQLTLLDVLGSARILWWRSSSQHADLALLAWEPVNGLMAYVRLMDHFAYISIVSEYALNSAVEVDDEEEWKPASQRIDATVFSGSPSSGRTFYVCDKVTRRRFLVDTGAQISVVPPTPVDRRCPSPGLHLQAANCSPISTFGSRSLTLNIGLRRLFSWIFLIADVPHSILGSDFLAEFDLRVDCRRSCLLDRTTGLSVRGLTPFNDSCNLSVLDTGIACPYRDLLLQHPNIIKRQFCSGEIQHDVVHHIRTSGPPPPVFARPRRLAASRLQAAKAEFEHMLQLGIIRPSENPWASPLHMVPKATSDDWRPCGNYRALNNATIPVRYPVPHPQDFAGALFGKSVFSKIDLVRAFHQIPVAPEDVPKTAVTTLFGLFEFIRMPFGLRNAA
ncbi:hypothetical protein SprV_0702417100 [Sparganum proliferum]